jgi:hypothetical protein
VECLHISLHELPAVGGFSPRDAGIACDRIHCTGVIPLRRKNLTFLPRVSRLVASSSIGPSSFSFIDHKWPYS